LLSEESDNIDQVFEEPIEACNTLAQFAVPMPPCLDEPILLQRAEIS
jgi:hypothetical protein